MLHNLFRFRKKVSHTKYGNIASIMKGQGLEKEDFRKYQPLDDFKAINRKLTAKYNDLFVSLFKPEKSIDMHVLRDINANRNAGVSELNKDLVSKLFLEVMQVSSKQSMNIISYYPTKERLQIFPIEHDVGKVGIMNKKMNESCKAAPGSYISHLEDFLKTQKKITKSHGILIFSDFLALSEQQAKTLKIMQEKNEVFLIRVPVPLREGENFSYRTVDDQKVDHHGLRFWPLEELV